MIDTIPGFGGQSIRKYIRIFLNLMIPALTVLFICLWGGKLLAFFLPFLVGWIVAMIANPLVRFMEKRVRIVRKHGSIALIAGVLALVVFALYELVSWCMWGVNGFLSILPELFDLIQGEVISAYEGLSARISFMPAEVESSFGDILASLGTSIGDMLSTLAATAGGAVARTLPEVLVNTIVILFSSYQFLAEHDAIVERVRAYMPESVLHYGRLIKKDIRTVVCGYFLAQFKIMLVVAVTLFAGLLILRVKYSVYLALGIALLDFLPMFGTGTALIPWAVVKAVTGEFAYAAGLVLLYILTQAIRQIIQPKIVGDSLGVPPLTTLFLLFLGFKLKGLAGMILAVPVGMLVIRLYEYGAFDSFLGSAKELASEIQKLRQEKEE